MRKIRWKQRFDNYLKALRTLDAAMDLARERELSTLEQQGLIQGFEYTHELAWNVFKDYLEYKGIFGLVGSRDATRGVFKNGLIEQGEVWMQMIADRNLTSHTYDQTRAQAIVDAISGKYYPAFKNMAERFTRIDQQLEDNPCATD
ncbi:MAG: nucleotidyltransferase substrate-binding protein, family [Magnetococcales bacterium]|nr:nucleotidyltransferase substrate-binding protein, family [Magnetococcales bacterium]